MKINITVALITFFIISCSKENTFKTNANDQTNIAALTSTTNIPINDLGAGKFKGYTGGLYPGGLNHPSGTYAVDLYKTCHSIVPIDTFGNPSVTKSGKVLMISLGWSIGSQNLRALKIKTTGNPLTNPKLLLESFSLGSGTARLNNIMNPNDAYWDYVAARIKDSNTSFRQVQIIYLDSEDSSDIIGFPARPLLVKSTLQSCFRVFEQKFPNVKLVYLVARTTTFGTQHVFNTEPCPYYFGWACKWAIEDQINGVAGTTYKGANKVSPMIAWGFYEWATSTPRITDSFSWTSDLMKDGLHANDEGKDTLSTRFQNFLLTDKFARNWYAK
ncbi:MAG: hypothetical protein ABJB05_05255 [Parafilimonas sp.]